MTELRPVLLSLDDPFTRRFEKDPLRCRRPSQVHQVLRRNKKHELFLKDYGTASVKSFFHYIVGTGGRPWHFQPVRDTPYTESEVFYRPSTPKEELMLHDTSHIPTKYPHRSEKGKYNYTYKRIRGQRSLRNFTQNRSRPLLVRYRSTNEQYRHPPSQSSEDKVVQQLQWR